MPTFVRDITWNLTVFYRLISIYIFMNHYPLLSKNSYNSFTSHNKPKVELEKAVS